MSILTRGPHTVRVTPAVRVQDSMGSTIRTGTPVELAGVAVQPLSADEADALGVQATTAYRVIGRGPWPGGPLSTVEVVTGPRTGLFDQRGEARQYAMSPRTAHYDVTITARGTDSR